MVQRDSEGAGPRPWGYAALWLAFLAPLFFGSYLGSLEVVSWRAEVPTLVFGWERHIPFLAWTVVPYWSIDLLYGLALFLCRTRTELTRLGLRLLSAQVAAVAIFLVAPLRLTSTIPADTGAFAPFFAALDGVVGKPYNLAPSLHIALLVILWVHYARHVPARWQPVMHGWAALIGVSVLTANQHHFFDVPTGAMLGFLCLWLSPDRGTSPLAEARLARNPRRLRLAAAYAAGAAFCLVTAILARGAALWLLWPAQSLLFVAAAYGFLGEGAFQKDRQGRLSLATRALLGPYLVAARINAWLCTRAEPASVPVAPGVRLGSMPCGSCASTAVIDLSAELCAPSSAADWRAFPMLDLIVPHPDALCTVAVEIERAVQEARRTGGEVTVCCALGRSRSAAAVAVWLAVFGGAADSTEAVSILRARRPRIALGARDIAAVGEACARADAGLVSRRCGVADGTPEGSLWPVRKRLSMVTP